VHARWFGGYGGNVKERFRLADPVTERNTMLPQFAVADDGALCAAQNPRTTQWIYR